MHCHHMIPALLLSTAPAAHAWGVLGHSTVAYVAQHYVTPSTANFVQAILGTAPDYMANVSSWPDTYRRTPEGEWSTQLHWIDANDAPPESCEVEYTRDCRPRAAKSTEAQLLDAIRFLIHFAGDIHQPLHTEALEEGGNGINITWDGKTANLHAIWDTQIPVKAAAGKNASEWAEEMVGLIENGKYNASGWLDATSLDDIKGTAMSWANDANDYVCTDVLPDGREAIEAEGVDLAGAYFEKHGEVTKELIARAGYRLGSFLNLIVDGPANGHWSDN
ncbi:Nuclease S1 [Cyphellophora attinorum]|uniref:Nuclease S1 n=1 Tax=Cyphellophora attinorum TaxID=1664694 RepID=A0A0N0NHE9_9EURO|nr:Nuclease S1 [Phialophora attinorum]KPI34611.1 Nuclease S1 [Phialophora attinorum]